MNMTFYWKLEVPEQHEYSSWHQEDLITGDELKNVLLIGCEFVQEIPYELQTVWSHCLKVKI